ncbi:MAG: 5-methyltetrahydropteroyltriglutamate--homocysteine methyltransferase, partial [Solirubrobacteraceae bacterium]|nr:5-methyltetrahydropteroyltriglutamate--homocysteine methyltransferase [Solirubrobacteraceae bacterium]
MGVIRSTHVGSLIRPPEVLEFQSARERGEAIDEAAYGKVLRECVADVVKRQADAGIEIVSDGELGKASWISYLYERVSGIESRPLPPEGSMMPPS